jgi:MFS family permease
MNARSDRLFSPAFIALTLSELAYFTAAGLVLGVTPFFVAGPVGSDEAGLGLVAASFGVTTLLLRPYAGRLSDRRGRRPLLVAGAMLAAVSLLAHPLTSDLTALVGLRLALGVGEALFFVAGFAALADLAPPGRAGEALSYNSLALYVGVALGPIIGQLLVDAGGFAAAWIGGSVLSLAAALLAMRLPEALARPALVAPAEDEPVPILHRAALRPGVALATGVAAMSGFLLLAGPHAERTGLDAWSLTFLLFGGIVVVVRLAFAKLPDRVPPMRLGAAALATAAVGLGIASVAPAIVGLIVGTVGLAVGVAFMTPALFAATFARVAPSERGAAAGTATLFIDLGFSGGPLLVGLLAARAGIPAAFAVAGMIALAGALATLGPPSRRTIPRRVRSVTAAR